MIEFRDLADEIFDSAGELRGGELNFVGSIQRATPSRGRGRLLVFGIDDNNADDEYTSLAVITPQRSAELRPVMQSNGGIMSVEVQRIGPPEPMLHDDTAEFFLRPVYGRLAFHPTAAEIGRRRRVGHLPDPYNALVASTYNAAGKIVHVHLVCLDDDGNRVSWEEKERRVVALKAALAESREDDEPAAKLNGAEPTGMADGNRRLAGILALLR